MNSRVGVVATKLGMGAMYAENGVRLPITLLRVEDCQVVGHKTLDRDGYNAVVIGALKTKADKIAKPQKKLFADAKTEPRKILKEFRVAESGNLEVGTEVKPSHFKVGQFVDVSGKSIGKGFAGAMKRHNFGGLRASHGVSIAHRSHGSTGQCQDPGKTFKGKKMAGHMGNANVTVQNLNVVVVDDEKGIIAVTGSVPGHKGAKVVIRDAVKKAMGA